MDVDVVVSSASHRSIGIITNLLFTMNEMVATTETETDIILDAQSLQLDSCLTTVSVEIYRKYTKPKFSKLDRTFV